MSRRVIVTLVLAYLLLQVTLGLRSAAISQAQPPGGSPAGTPAPADSFARERDSLMQVVLSLIQGRENAPAESVFKNIRNLRGFPAGRLVRVMNLGYGRSLGVSCGHCHVVGEWEKDDKPPKQITRDMMRLVAAINDTLLPRVRGLAARTAPTAGGTGPVKPTVNCTTCHRGAVKPALNL
jgi:hypothetical protein